MTIFETALEETNAIAKQHRREAEQVYETALQDPAFAEAERAVRSLTPLLARAKVFKEEAELKRLSAEAEQWGKKRAAAMKRLGLTERSFRPKATCPKCNDTGFAANKACSCLNQRIIRILERTSGIPERTLNTFEDSKPEKFSEAERKVLLPLYDKMQQYADKYPNVAKRDLLFLGPAGSGKTFLINAIAERIGSRGYTVLYATAFSLNNLFLKYHTTFDGDKTVYMDNLLNCDLLIVDDLGTEPILKNVTQEYLFSVVNERMVAGRGLIVSTNLTLAELSARYGERTASRLYNKSTTNTVRFNAGNMRAKNG